MAKEATAKKVTGKAKAAKAPKEPKAAQALVVVKSGAMSTDVGPAVVMGLAKTYEQEEKANEMLNQVKGKRYDLLSNTTLAIAKAFKADDTISAASAFSADKKEVQKLNDQLLIALGIREYADVKGKQKLVYSKTVSRYFPGPKDEKGKPETVRKATLRSNVIHMIKKCAQAAVTIHEKGVKASMDPESGTLRISGPEVQKTFGASEVLLNEKQTVQHGETATQLSERPSFQALANMSAADHGATTKQGSSDRTNKVVTDPEAVIEQLCKQLVTAIGKLKEVTERQKVALESAASAIDAKLA